MAEGPGIGLRFIQIERLDADLAEFHPLHAARADLLRRAEAAAAYARAIAQCANVVERRYLERRLAEVS